MVDIIDFNSKRKKKLYKNKFSLGKLNLSPRDVDVETLYAELNKKYKINIPTTSGGSKEFVRCEDEQELFRELSCLVESFESDQSAWIVLGKNYDYIYIKEKSKIYKASKGVFEDKIKDVTYEYGIDFIVILEKINCNTYRLIAS